MRARAVTPQEAQGLARRVKHLRLISRETPSVLLLAEAKAEDPEEESAAK